MTLNDQKICKVCRKLLPIENFPLYKSGRPKIFCLECQPSFEITHHKKRSPDEMAEKRKYFKRYYYLDSHRGKIRAYQTFDRKHGWETITLEDFRKLLILQRYCNYCGETENSYLGLDRKDNNKGHSVDNVVICCEKCNNLLQDISFEAKLCLKAGLTEIKQKGLLTNWIIRTKRKNEYKRHSRSN